MQLSRVEPYTVNALYKHPLRIELTPVTNTSIHTRYEHSILLISIYPSLPTKVAEISKARIHPVEYSSIFFIHDIDQLLISRISLCKGATLRGCRFLTPLAGATFIRNWQDVRKRPGC